MLLEDGKGRGFSAEVDEKQRLSTLAVTVGAELYSADSGNAYNINTGNITMSASGTLLYLKNTGDADIVISTLIVGLGSGTVSDLAEITVIRNPTGGDLITDATPVPMNVNRNFGSSNSLSSNVYKGKSGGIVTGGDEGVLFYQGVGGRMVSAMNLMLTKGTSMAIKLDPKLTSGSIKCYCALVIYTE